jgi:transposase
MGSYSQEFKDQVVELHRRDGRTFMELAKEFNLSATTIGNWTRAADKRDSSRRVTGPPAGPPAESDQAKIARLERELARKEEELEILGKALAFFARRTDR